MKGNDIRGVFFGIEGPDASLSHYLWDYFFLASRVGRIRSRDVESMLRESYNGKSI